MGAAAMLAAPCSATSAFSSVLHPVLFRAVPPEAVLTGPVGAAVSLSPFSTRLVHGHFSLPGGGCRDVGGEAGQSCRQGSPATTVRTLGGC